ncbi:hypothetical protein BUALT_Bualt08G0132700 [Buddleja alternifolia]|uniref:non-specific serine/threonine protein kinase n=1 Tax=Buddleja alternifolia TaxID=168488 RepID=A0AAV6XEE5_9LAMI|nr:hypothetical protein BUALT_Bualt08G0132700 [Buddleja alternifolia]
MENSCFFIVVVTLLLLKCTTLCSSRNLFNSSTDEDALLAFKATITSDPYGILVNNWSTNNAPVCYWIGVSCGIKQRRVTSLNLSGFHLRGTVAPHLGNLTFLRSLDISFNNFTGIIPDKMSNLRRLKEINVEVNTFTGEIPPWFGTLHELQHIYLNDNTFTGSIPPSLFNTTSKLLTLDIGYNFLGGNVPQEIQNFSSLEKLNLEFNQFTVGSLPHGIFKVSSIRTINLKGCSLSGMLPSDMCNSIPKLKMLHLSKNQLFGQIPPNIYKCRNLEDLRLTYNHFDGNIPSEIGSLVNLKILALGANSFGGGIPKQLGNPTSLNSISLYDNKLTGELPQELSNLAYLEAFDVSYNVLSGSIPSFMFNISTLKIMSLSSNHFSGNLPSTIGMGLTLLILEQLYLGQNRLMGTIPNYITNASTLTHLDMETNSFSGPVPSFGNLRLLQELRIWENNLTGNLRFLSSLTNCRYLRVLQISENPLNGILPTSIGNLSTTLQQFGARKCRITGAIPPEIGNLSSLRQLSLSSNQLTGFIPTTLGKLEHLEELTLSRNMLQGYIPPDLCQMSNLVYLYLYTNMLTGAIPDCLGELTTLSRVHLGSNNLNSTIPSNFWNLVDLLELNLSSNYLNGQLSLDIGSLNVIISIDLSLNQFSGDIPSSIGTSQTIEFLSLAHNKFESSIPKSLGNIINLESLDLSNNNLSGTIPKSLEGLRYLRYFNVSYNKLEGEIPTGGPFVDFTAQSFLQNSALCGATRFHVQLCTRSRPKNISSLLVKYILPPIISTIILVVIMIVIIRRRIRKHNKVAVPADISLGIAWRKISYQELVCGTSAFSEANLLGKGGFGSVFRGILSDDKLNVAIKVFNMQLEGASKSFDTESEILSSVRHRNLVRIIGCCCNTEFKALILAYMPNGSLEKWLYIESYCLDVLQRVKIAIDVALALEYLHHGHTFPVVHCDIKPSNILLDEDMTAHVADFGLSKLFDEGEVVIQTNTLATIGYTAPEYGSEGKVSTNGDVYSYGILLLEMFTMKKPTDDMFSEEMSLKDWVSGAILQENSIDEVVAPGLLTRDDQHFSAKEQCVSSVFGLAMECLAFSPDERINTIQIVAALQKINATVIAGIQRRENLLLL